MRGSLEDSELDGGADEEGGSVVGGSEVGAGFDEDGGFVVSVGPGPPVSGGGPPGAGASGALERSRVVDDVVPEDAVRPALEDTSTAPPTGRGPEEGADRCGPFVGVPVVHEDECCGAATIRGVRNGSCCWLPTAIAAIVANPVATTMPKPASTARRRGRESGSSSTVSIAAPLGRAASLLRADAPARTRA